MTDGRDRGVQPTGWRPEPRERRTTHAKQMFVAVAVALVLGAALIAVFARVASRSPEKINLGSRVFDLGPEKRRVSQATLGPLVFNDLVRDDRPVALAVAYLGPKNWVALNLIPEGAKPACAARWDRSRKIFVDPCTSQQYAPDGSATGSRPLRQYHVEITKKGQLVVDLNRDPSPTAES